MSRVPADWDKEIAAFVSYCSRFEPAFSETIVGASEDDLARVAMLAKLPLPPEYRAFHRAMGRTPPGALGKFFEHLVYGIPAIERFYLKPQIPVPDDAIYLWTLDYDFEMFLTLQPDGSEPRAVVQFGWSRDETGELLPQERQVATVARSLMQYLYREAFVEIGLPSLEFRARLRETMRVTKPNPDESAAQHARFRELSARLKFEPVPYMDDGLIFFDRPDAAVGLFGEAVAPDSLYISAASELALRSLVEIFSDNLNFARES